ncbi:guanine nucleotide-binding protein subunit gamma-1-like [Ruditapes philippinarum]|uniref:guanine nucleotide-binding protein subunit gamma-1-like n=1 Tax=Ruditapes philippinarum TaxID=129788 RepID=UPI00295AD7A1|nr:guanine nucleotide-binding protein subunit gamma-1-like [Ruditapes philippinarum]
MSLFGRGFFEDKAKDMITLMAREILELREFREQLLVELHRDPMKCSDAMKELIDYVKQHEDEDRLVKGFQNSKENPFSDQGATCVII